MKDAAKVWFTLVPEKFRGARLEEIENAPCIFQNDHVVVVRFVADPLVFEKADVDVAQLESSLVNDLIVKDLGIPISLVSIEIL